MVTKWSNELYVNFTSEDWKRIHAISYYSISENYYKWFQFRLVHSILGIRKRLYLMKLSDSDLCGLCNLKLRVLYIYIWNVIIQNYFGRNWIVF